jgi:hypothetical protein
LAQVSKQAFCVGLCLSDIQPCCGSQRFWLDVLQHELVS